MRATKRVRAVVGAVVAATLATLGLASASGAQTGSEPGVTGNSITVGYIYSKGGIAGSTFLRAGDAFQARIARENAKGGVNGRKIKTEIIDDSGNENNLAAAQDLVERRNVFAVVDNSPFAFLAYRYLLEKNVPMIGGGYDGTEYGQRGNENLISASGNQAPGFGATYGFNATLMKRFKSKNVASVGYGISPSSTASAKNFQTYAVKAAGANAAYTNTSVDFGTTEVSPIVLGMKNANVDTVNLPLVASTNFAILRTAREQGLNLKLGIIATGYGQPLLDDPSIVSILGPNVLFSTGAWAPVEDKTPATKQFQADLKKYNGFTGVPDYGQYTGYTTADLFIEGLKAAGKSPTRQSFVDATKGLKNWRSAGMACQAIDLSKEGFGQAAPQGCNYYVYVKKGKFVPYNKGKPLTGKLLNASSLTAPSSS